MNNPAFVAFNLSVKVSARQRAFCLFFDFIHKMMTKGEGDDGYGTNDSRGGTGIVAGGRIDIKTRFYFEIAPPLFRSASFFIY